MKAAFRFPATVACPFGGHGQRVSRPNRFSCPRCGGVFSVSESGRVKSIAEPGSRAVRPPAMTCVQMHFPSDISLLPRLRRAVRQVGSGLGVRGQVLGDLELCFEEAAMNVIVHGYGYDRTRPVVMDMGFDRGRGSVHLILKDRGRPSPGGWKVDKARVRRRVRARKAGGLGRFLIQTLMDQVSLKRQAGWNVLRMERRLVVR